MQVHDRYVLALAVLEGDRDARWVLADLLEEQGDRGLAQWARASKSRVCDRLDFVLALLPWPRALKLGWEFFMQGRDYLPPVGDSRLETKFILAIQQWCEGTGGRERAHESCGGLASLFESSEHLATRRSWERDQRYRGTLWQGEGPLELLIGATNAALCHTASEVDLPGVSFPVWKDEIIVPVRRATRRIGLIAASYGRDVISRQFERTKAELLSL